MPFALDGGNEITFDLLAGAALQNVGRTPDAHLQGIARTAQLALHQCEAQSIQPAAAEFFRHVGGIETKLDTLALDLLRDFGGHIVELLDPIFMRI